MTGILSRRTVLGSLAAVSAASLLAACSDSNSGSAQAQTTTGSTSNVPSPSGKVDMTKVLAEGSLPDKVIGNDDAPITIVEYASMTCGHCANFHRNTLPEIKKNYIDSGKARLILREFPFDPRAEAGFMLARCADDKYFAMIDVLFQQQQNWAGVENARDALLQIARLGGFSQESFEACLTDQNLLDQVRQVRDRGAKEFNVDSTPTFFINGNVYKGALRVEEMSAILDSML
ncbi:DsbA family protein [Aquamicrobium zhengzhouense]|uniref:DsbA family protein n=1 Tax=Aquamicrobium zhengzhouense TaxID=2781738 RepID=A0ABS0SFE0_9HYPH|nr:DsbA family protein [Aquamicrobium zhengzhouense]MBI1622010.1 DsbA family protein [Aquamicrobium zhengzhouense]